MSTNPTTTEVESTTADTHTLDSLDVEHHVSTRTNCAECGGQLITANDETFCEDCGLVLATEFMDRSPTLVQLGIKGDDGSRTVEPDNPFGVDKSHGSVIWGRLDANGNTLSEKKQRQLARLKKWHKRYSIDGNRDRRSRLADVMNDVQLLQGRLSLPRYVALDAVELLRDASAARLPGGRMAWESLAAGAVVVACNMDGIARDTREVARYSKTTHERVCAAARKIRVQLQVDAPPVREEPVQAVLDALPEGTISGVEYARYGTLAQHLLDLADKNEIAPGTPRIAAACAAFKAAWSFDHDRCEFSSTLNDAATTIVDVPTNSSLNRYARMMSEAFHDRHGDVSIDEWLRGQGVKFTA